MLGTVTYVQSCTFKKHCIENSKMQARMHFICLLKIQDFTRPINCFKTGDGFE